MNFPDNTGTPGNMAPLGSFTGDAVNENSIGDGSSDQGIEPGEEKREDEFRKGKPGEEEILDKENIRHNKRPSHGLVEEGPGPDA
jgi:hypothetical protein